MSEQEAFILANQSLEAVVDQIRDDQWDMPMPEDFLQSGTDEMTAREVINYHAYDDAWVPDVLEGKTIDQVGSKYDGDLLGEDPKASFASIGEKANRAVRGLTELDRIVHLSYGDFPAREYLQHITVFRGLRVHDLAKAFGGDTKMPDDLVRGLWDIVEPNAEQWRAMGVFGPAVEVSESADLQSKLLGVTGRQPR